MSTSTTTYRRPWTSRPTAATGSTGRRQPHLHDEPAGRRPPVGQYVPGGSVRWQPARHLPENLQNHAGQLCRMDRNIADPAFNITAVETVRANVSSDGQDNGGEFRHLHQHPQLAQRPGDQFRAGGPRRPRHAEPAELAHGRATRQPGDEPADLQHLHRPGNDRESQLRESAQHVHPEGAEPMGAEQPEGAWT